MTSKIPKLLKVSFVRSKNLSGFTLVKYLVLLILHRSASVRVTSPATEMLCLDDDPSVKRARKFSCQVHFFKILVKFTATFFHTNVVFKISRLAASDAKVLLVCSKKIACHFKDGTVFSIAFYVMTANKSMRYFRSDKTSCFHRYSNFHMNVEYNVTTYTYVFKLFV